MDPLGRQVSERLEITPGVARVPSPLLDLFISRGFLATGECHYIMALIEMDRKPSRLFSTHPDPQFRTSETCNLDRRDGVVRQIEGRITALLKLDPRHGEPLQGQRYDTGQQFKPHHDYLRPDLPYWKHQKDIGGQRTWTAMVYLNTPAVGGETYFPEVDLLIKPREGSLVMWNNLNRDGQPNPATLHQGMPVLSGVKCIITKWFRERPWG